MAVGNYFPSATRMLRLRWGPLFYPQGLYETHVATLGRRMLLGFLMLYILES